MPARSGRNYLQGLREQEREVWLAGERIRDVTAHAGLRRGAETIARLYDMQFDSELRSEMTFTPPEGGEPAGLSFIIPRTREDLERRRAMMLHWARASCGMMGRSPDFMNVTFAAWAGAADYFAAARPEFGENVRRYHRYIRDNDLTLTHSLINLQRSRTVSGLFNLEEGTALQVVRETDRGVIVRGARVLATLGPIADEIAVYSPRAAQHAEGHSPFVVNFAIPCGTPGVRFLCRESYDLGRSHFDHPLGSRFEEMDCIVFFDDVLVPWDRVFLLYDVERLNGTAAATHYSVHSAHQGATKNLAKCEFVLGLALLMSETLGSEHLPGVQEKLAELTLTTVLMKACIRAGEADAKRDEWNVMCPDSLPVESTRNLFMTAYPRMVEILQLLGSSSFLLTPSKKDMEGPLAPQIAQYLATEHATADERVRLFHAAWDTAISAFGTRQVLYERFFASDPLTRARVLNTMFPKQEVKQRVLDFLHRDAIED
jgi:4-hydroxyphenylacetate 3-monooxygenase